MKKALIITYYWPPAGGGGVQRVAKFCKYLSQNGWKPIVLTVRDGNFAQLDPSQEQDVAEVAKVYYANSYEPHALFHALRPKPSKPASTPSDPAAPSRRSRLFKTFGESIRLNLFIPDSRIGWLCPAVKMGRHIIETEKPDVIFSSAPPYTTHLIARKLHAQFSIPWVADFRDPWFENLTYNTVPRLGLVKALTLRMEKQVLTEAEQVLTVGTHLQKLLQSKLPPETQDKVSVITNGYDSNDIVTETPDPFDAFTLSFYGTLYSNGFPGAFFDAVQCLADENPDFARDYAIRITGHVPKDVAARARELAPPDKLSFHSYLPHDEVLTQLYRPQVLLLVINQVPHSELIITGKIFDYLPTGNPIVGLGPRNGDAADVLRRSQTGEMFEHADIDGIKSFIEARYKDWTAGRLNTGVKSLPAYTRETLTSQLAALFESMG